jgi:hypothetical protein
MECLVLSGASSLRLACEGSSILTLIRSASNPNGITARIRPRNGLGVDIARKAVFLPQQPKGLDHLFAGVIGVFHHP